MTLRYLGLGIFIATTQERNNQEINSGLCISQMPIFSFKCGLESRITFEAALRMLHISTL